MSYLSTNCSQGNGDTGKQQCVGSPGRTERLWLVPPDFEVDTEANALLETTWDTLFNAAKGTRGYPLPTIFNATFEQGEDQYETGWSNKQDFVNEGLDKDKFMSDKISLYNAAQLRTFNGIDWKAYEITDKGIIKGWSDDGIKFKPFSIKDFRVGKRTKETGEAVERVPITVVWGNPTEWNDYPAIIEPDWNPLELEGVKHLQVVASSPTTTGVTLTLTGFDGVPHEGAVLADFVIYNNAGASITISSATEGNAGVYALLATLPAGTYTAGLKNQPNATTKYFETPTLASFTR